MSSHWILRGMRVTVRGPEIGPDPGSSEDDSSSEGEQETESVGGGPEEQVPMEAQAKHQKITADLPEPEDEAMEEITTAGGRGEPVELVGLRISGP